MNGTGKHLAVLAAFALVAVACSGPGVADVTSSEARFAKSDNAPVVRVSGGGTVDVPAGRSKYTFQASQNGAGEVNGGFDLHFSSSDVNVHGDVSCLIVVGNFARLTGVVTRSSDETLMEVGRVLHWQAIDNGEGSKAAPDRVSAFYSVGTPPTFCDYGAVATNEWTNGNVQIK